MQKKSSPLARRLAKLKNVNLETIQGSGPYGRIIARDIEASFVSNAQQSSVPVPLNVPLESFKRSNNLDPRVFYNKDSYEEIQLDTMRRTIAMRLSEAKQTIPHIYLSADCDLTHLLETRKQLNSTLKDDKISVNDLIIKCVALALMKVPDVNVCFAETSILRHKNADISVAVALDGGLITPIVKQADKKGVLTISREMKELVQRAKIKKLKPNEYEGGSFSISNMGMLGVQSFYAIINPPQAAILAIGQGQERVVAKDGHITICPMMTVCLSCDHRAIDGATGAAFLQAFKSLVESPALMIC